MTEIIRTCDQSSQTISNCEKSCQTITLFDKSAETIINNKITPNTSKNFIENRMMRNYYRKRNIHTNILNLTIESESHREKAKKEIIKDFNKNNNEVPKWLLGIKQ
jgi:hypothetical protein